VLLGADKKTVDPTDIIGNHYCTQYADAWDVAVRTSARLPELEERTLAFVNAYLSADVPEVIKEAALFNVVCLRSQTCFRTPDGHFFGGEGTHNYGGSCFGSCTHVWNYEQGLGFLFGELSRDMRETELLHNTLACGAISARVKLPLPKSDNERFRLSAADGHLGVIMRTYRDWQLSGDDAFVKHTGHGVSHEITRVRLEQAIELLRNTDRKLAIIAHDVGFSSAPYMSAVFQRQLKRSPGSFRP